MPATSKKQRRAMAIAEHHPESLHKENKGMLNMSKGQQHDFAATSEKGLPAKVHQSKKPKVKKSETPKYGSSSMKYLHHD